MGGGPPGFPASSSCSPVLWILSPARRFRLRDYHPLWFGFPTNSANNLQWILQSATPTVLLQSVWPLPISLAATLGIDVSFSSSAYLDVSVQRVSPRMAMYSLNDNKFRSCWVPPFGNLWFKAYLRLPTAYRSLSRPSSAPDAKAFVVCSF